MTDYPMVAHQKRPSAKRIGKTLLHDLLNSKSVIAVGLDPDAKTVHFYIKSGASEQKWVKPLSPDHAFTLELVKGFLRGMGV